MKNITMLVALFWGSTIAWYASAQESATYGAYRISGPYTAKNLSLFFIHGSSDSHLPLLLTLNEAMSAGSVTVYETGEVNKLEIENKSDTAVFIQSGDLVTGGRQDRMLVYDLILKPQSGKTPLPTFCVESDRWSPRPDDSGTVFSSAANVVANRELKVAATVHKSQGEIWDKIEEMSETSEELHVRGSGTMSYCVMLDSWGIQHDTLIEEVVSQMNRSLENSSDVIGMAFAINGEVNSADIYGDANLFRKQWPNLIEACVTEAFGWRREQNTAYPLLSAADLVAWMRTADDTEANEQVINDLTTLTIKQREEVSVFETHIGENGILIHKNYLGIKP